MGSEPGYAILWKWFCSHCGCPNPLLTCNGKIMVIPAGSLDTVPPITLTDHIFWASRASSGCASGGLPTHAEYPESW
ncbi:GFA family protein [Funiculus sociatus GB2-M2]|nr:GFA family protein [Trichocoleus sp. FACHB-90]